MLYFIGVGPTLKDITERAKEIIKKSEEVYLEGYTNFLGFSVEDLKKEIKKDIIEVNRSFIEEGMERIIEEAKEKDIVIITLGNPLFATTHFYYFIEGKKKGVKVKFIHSPSIMDLILEIGLHPYKFGKIASISFHYSETPYEILKENLSINAHTLFLLDLNPKGGRFMTINEGISRLLEIEEKKREEIISKDSMVIGCARLGREDKKIVYSKIERLLEIDFGDPPYCMVFPAKDLHFTEEEALEIWKIP